MRVIDNINSLLGDDLKSSLKQNSKLKIAASCFSIYAFEGLEEGQRLSLEHKLDQQFLREVSQYLNDLRLIKNIFNEFATYAANLGSANDDSLDPNKLLAVLIYKNVQPSDFEKLHQQQGALADILSRYEEFISSAEADVRAQILEIRPDS